MWRRGSTSSACLTLAALAMVILASGLVLSFEGPAWYHTSSVGLFINSLHFWSVQLFFLFMVLHLWGKFWMAAWRGRRALTWITGMVAFMVSIVAGMTGYVLQTQPRLAVDRLRGEGRPERGRARCLVQRDQPGADAAHARLPASAGHRSARGRARGPGPPSRRGAAD